MIVISSPQPAQIGSGYVTIKTNFGEYKCDRLGLMENSIKYRLFYSASLKVEIHVDCQKAFFDEFCRYIEGEKLEISEENVEFFHIIGHNFVIPGLLGITVPFLFLVEQSMICVQKFSFSSADFCAKTFILFSLTKSYDLLTENQLETILEHDYIKFIPNRLVEKRIRSYIQSHPSSLQQLMKFYQRIKSKNMDKRDFGLNMSDDFDDHEIISREWEYLVSYLSKMQIPVKCHQLSSESQYKCELGLFTTNHYAISQHELRNESFLCTSVVPQCEPSLELPTKMLIKSKRPRIELG